MKKAKIGIVSNILVMDTGSMPGLMRAYVNQDYVESLERAGCIPVMLPVIRHLENVKEQLQGLDGVLLSGGYDIDPLLYREQPIHGQGFSMREVDRFYLAVIQEASALQIPILGICKGIQAINVAFGGTLYQDLKTQLSTSLQHDQQAPRQNASHTVDIEPDSFIGRILGQTACVNSFHHQAVKDVAEGFLVTARAADGVIESIERKGGSFICGVQWHPEMMTSFGNETMLELFRHFAALCCLERRCSDEKNN